MRISSRMHLRSSSDGNNSAGSGVGLFGGSSAESPVTGCPKLRRSESSAKIVA